jgi:spore coat protein CotH
MWVNCSFKYNDKEWYHVGIRYKGNSSLQSTYQSGIKKFSFKLDFDEFEGDYPAIKDQRFYGFKQLNLKNNYLDASLMREKVGADLFRQFGLASSETAFCVVYVDNGTGPQYYGVYTLVEEVDDTVLDSQFANGSGNLYKPDGTAASFASGSYNTSQFELKTNEDSANYSDVKALYDIINSSTRTSDVETWKANLESVFNVDVFLKYLAANNTIQNWDTYGRMTHNYYLYNNPDNSLLTWIPWDNNEAFQTGKNGGALSFSMSEVGTGWPLIKYIIAQPEYEAIYETYLQQFISEVFNPADMVSTYSTYYDLIKEYAYAEETGYTFISSDSQFDQAVATLKTHVQSRNTAVNSYLK